MNYIYTLLFICFFFFQIHPIEAFPPSNDDCSTATSLTVNADLNCTSFSSGTVFDATDSGIADVCPGDYSDDVWFSFVATSTSHVIALQNIAGSTTNLNHQFFSGFCNNLVSVYCSDANSSVASNLAINKVYYIRVATETMTPNQTTTFDICITTPPPVPANDDCEGAIALTMNTDLNCGSTTVGKVAGATPSGNTDVCFGVYDDDVWFSFVATQTSHQVSLINVSGSDVDLTHEVLAGACDGIFSVYCSDENTSSAGGLFVGQTYFVRVATVTGTAGQNTTFEICVGEFPAAPSNDDCATATSLTHTSSCNPLMQNIGSATDSGQAASSCGGSPNDDMWYSFVAGAINPTIEVNAVFDGIAELFEGTCDALTALDCIDLSMSTSFSPTNLVVGQTYWLRVYAFSSFTPTGTNANFDICVYGGTPENDICANAIDILNDVLNESTFSGSTIGANDTDAPADNCSSPSSTGRGVWFVFDYNEASATTVTFTGSTGLRIYGYAGTCGAVTCVANASGQGTDNCSITIDNGNFVATTYYLYVSNVSGTAFTINVRNESALPIELKQFSGYVEGTSNVLTWTTAVETEPSNFVLQRSADGEKDWTTLTEMTSLGHATGHHYQFIDKFPLATAYYRLKYERIAGKETFSEIISINTTVGEMLTFYPNPTQETIFFEYDHRQTESIFIKIYNSNGQLIKEDALTRHKNRIDVSDLEKGLYFIRWINEGRDVLEKLVKFQ